MIPPQVVLPSRGITSEGAHPAIRSFPLNSQIILLGICGGSGSGKTTFCRELLSFLGPDRVSLISQDSYYRCLAHLSPEVRAQTNFDHPEALDFGLLKDHLLQLKHGKEVQIPQYDFASHSRRKSFTAVAPRPILAVEGILIFSHPDLIELFDHTIFIDTAEPLRLARRLARDVRDRGRTPESVLEQFKATVQPMHNQFVEPNKKWARRILSGEVPFSEKEFSAVAGLIP